ncbi:MAG: hypothetical protein DHS20C01_16300 [marine bacterium B5-7]|nr:MAG: hypothetical protein DHS20C01_16300 [marine bacterium B5-7]
MTPPAQGHTLDFKNRITGAVILIAAAILLVYFLLNDAQDGVNTNISNQSEDGSFVSRIVETASDDSNLPAPVSPPPLPDESIDTSQDTATPVKKSSTNQPGSAASSAKPVSGTSDKNSRNSNELKLTPVLKQETRLGAPIPKLNTVKVEPTIKSTKPVVEASKQNTQSNAQAGGWEVRVGAFIKSENASRIAAQLKKGGYSPHRVRIDNNGQSLIRVWVGPFSDRKEAIRVKTEIAEKFALNGFVIRAE